ncbi:hypothetical protein Tco_0879673, partial [Tanacetum coccineum]
VEDFWRTQDEWIVSSWKLYPKSSVHVLDLTNGKTVYMFVDKFYPIRATLLERMLRHRLTVPPSYCRDVVVAGNIIQTVQAGLRQAYECIASAPIACTARQMVFSSPWLTAKSSSPLQTALVCTQIPLMVARFPKNGWYSFFHVPVGDEMKMARHRGYGFGKDPFSNPVDSDTLLQIVYVSTLTNITLWVYVFTEIGINCPRGDSHLVKAYQFYFVAAKTELCCFYDFAACIVACWLRCIVVFVMLLLFVLAVSSIFVITYVLLAIPSRASRDLSGNME